VRRCTEPLLCCVVEDLSGTIRFPDNRGPATGVRSAAKSSTLLAFSKCSWDQLG
jgi:hypothetical protein